MTFKNLAEIQKDLCNGEYSLAQLLDKYLENIYLYKDRNAYVEVFEGEAKKAALALDLRINSSPEDLGPLFGAVISIKDNICYKGHKASAASKMLKDFESPYSATAVERLIEADAIIIGRTNCDEFSMGSTSESSVYGPVKNALDPTRVPGGSTGGGAVAVSLQTCLASLGSDTGGSVRQPAAFNGIIGYKPSYGLISRWGLIAYGSSFDQIGILSRNIPDLAKILNVVSGPDEFDSTAISEKFEQIELIQTDISNVKCVYFSDMLDHEKLKPNVKAGFNSFIDGLKSQGAAVDSMLFPYTNYLVPVYYVLCSAEASSNLSRFDGIRYGHRAEGEFEDYRELIKQSRTQGIGKEVKKRIILGNYVLSEGHYDAYFRKAQQVRGLISRYVDQLFDDYDFILIPSSTSEAWPLDVEFTDPLEAYLSDIYTVLANLCGIPAISIPLTNINSNLSFGIQVLSKSKCDKSILNFITSLNFIP